jgi:hypothetical protein
MDRVPGGFARPMIAVRRPTERRHLGRGSKPGIVWWSRPLGPVIVATTSSPIRAQRIVDIAHFPSNDLPALPACKTSHHDAAEFI